MCDVDLPGWLSVIPEGVTSWPSLLEVEWTPIDLHRIAPSVLRSRRRPRFSHVESNHSRRAGAWMTMPLLLRVDSQRPCAPEPRWL